jgi:uncharacterized RDD family membrane protein YckC
MASPAPNPGGGISSAPTPQAVLRPHASLARRIPAYLIDIIIGFSMMMAAGYTARFPFAYGLLTPIQPTDPLSLWNSLGVGLKLAVLLAYVLAMGPIYFALFESSPWQATFGKRLLTIHVTGDEGQRVSLARSSGRWITRFFIGLFGGSLVSIITIAVTENRKAIHDYLAHTLVLKGRPASGGSLGAWRLVAAFGLPFLVTVGIYIAVLIAPSSPQARVHCASVASCIGSRSTAVETEIPPPR